LTIAPGERPCLRRLSVIRQSRLPSQPRLTSRACARTRPPSEREIRDEQLMGELARVHRDNYSVYGVKKMHAAMKRRGWHLGKERTRRLMRKVHDRSANIDANCRATTLQTVDPCRDVTGTVETLADCLGLLRHLGRGDWGASSANIVTTMSDRPSFL
jgi:hypothetical protein